MNRILIGALGALLLVAAGVFWWQGRAATDRAPPVPAEALGHPRGDASAEALPEVDPGDAEGPELPGIPEPSKEEKRFDRYDRDHDGKITLGELLAPRVKAFRKLDVDGNNLLTFDEWAVATIRKFHAADKGGKGYLTRADFAATKAPHKARARPECTCVKGK